MYLLTYLLKRVHGPTLANFYSLFRLVKWVFPGLGRIDSQTCAAFA